MSDQDRGLDRETDEYRGGGATSNRRHWDESRVFTDLAEDVLR